VSLEVCLHRDSFKFRRLITGEKPIPRLESTLGKGERRPQTDAPRSFLEEDVLYGTHH
jgi:hypothetical protein